MRNLVLGGVGVVWGICVIVFGMSTRGVPGRSGANATGAAIGWFLGIAFIIAGGWALIQGIFEVLEAEPTNAPSGPRKKKKKKRSEDEDRRRDDDRDDDRPRRRDRDDDRDEDRPPRRYRDDDRDEDRPRRRYRDD